MLLDEVSHDAVSPHSLPNKVGVTAKSSSASSCRVVLCVLYAKTTKIGSRKAYIDAHQRLEDRKGPVVGVGVSLFVEPNDVEICYNAPVYHCEAFADDGEVTGDNHLV